MGLPRLFEGWRAAASTGSSGGGGGTPVHQPTFTDNITSATTSQGTATPLTTVWNRITAGSDGTAVVLPTAVAAGTTYIVFNDDTGNPTNFQRVFPGSGERILPNLLNTASFVPVGCGALYFSLGGGFWKEFVLSGKSDASNVRVGNIQNFYNGINILGGAVVSSGMSIAGAFTLSQAGTLTPAGTTQAVNFNNAPSQFVDLSSATGNVTITLQNGQAGTSYMVKIKQSATARTVTWAGGVLWPAGSPPTITITSGAIDLYEFYFDGTNFLGRTYGQAFA